MTTSSTTNSSGRCRQIQPANADHPDGSWYRRPDRRARDSPRHSDRLAITDHHGTPALLRRLPGDPDPRRNLTPAVAEGPQPGHGVPDGLLHFVGERHQIRQAVHVTGRHPTARSADHPPRERGVRVVLHHRPSRPLRCQGVLDVRRPHSEGRHQCHPIDVRTG